MKKRKTYLAICMAGALAVSGLAGCGESVTAEELVPEVQENAQNADSMEAGLSARISAKVPADVLSSLMGSSGSSAAATADVEAEVTLDGEIQAIREDTTYLNMDLEVSAAGMMQSMALEAYLVQDGDTLKAYAATDGEWTYSESEVESDTAMDSMNQLLDDGMDWVLEEDTEEVGGTEAYVLTAALSGEELLQIAQEAAGASGEDVDLDSLLEETGVDFSKLNLDLVWYVDQEERTPLGMELDFGSSLTDLLADTPLAGVEVEISFELTDMAYNSVEEIAVPEEALAAAGGAEPETEPEMESEESTDSFLGEVTQPAAEATTEAATEAGEETIPDYEAGAAAINAAGQFTLTSYSGGLTINGTLPAGYTCGYGTENMVRLDAEDGSNSVTYSLMDKELWTIEELAEDPDSWVEYMQEDTENYKDIVISDLQTATVAGREVSYRLLTYNAYGLDYQEYYAWVDTGSAICEIETDGDQTGQTVEEFLAPFVENLAF